MSFAFRNSKLLVLLFPLILVSCVEFRDPNKEKSKSNTEQTSSLSAEVSPLEQPNQYLVTIKGVTPLSVVTRNPVMKQHDLLNQGTSAVVTVKNIIAEDNVSEPGDYIYSIQQNGRKYELAVEVPKDFVFEGEQEIDSLMSLSFSDDKDPYRKIETNGRVFFRAGASLTTEGENLLIQVAMIDSEGATIQTFKDQQTAQEGKAGRAGGKIKLVAKSIRGTLHAIMRGENGGQAVPLRPGVNKFEDLNGNGGAGGNSGALRVEIPDQSNGSVSYTLAPGKGADGTAVQKFCFLPKTTSNPCDAFYRNPTNRIVGVKGLDGVAEQPTGILQSTSQL